MDSEAFDRLARLLGTPGSRRAALAALLGVGALGAAGAEAKNRRRRKRKTRGKGQAKKPRLRRCPDPGPGQNLSRCDFSLADLRGRNLSGSNLSQARLVGAELCGADLSGANLRQPDFTGAHLTRVDFSGTNLAKAILTDAHFCQTTRPNGTLDHTHCPPEGADVCCGDDECDGVCQRGHCLERDCHNLGQLCQSFPFEVCGHCCHSLPECDDAGVECLPEVDLITWRCRKNCGSDADCAPYGDNFECRHDIFECPGSDKCCLAKSCSHDNDCASGKCCSESIHNAVCCRRDQRCGFPAFELPCVDL